MTPREELDALARRVCNWGRWGKDDQLGTVNLVTPEARRRGAACVLEGRAFSLGLNLSESEGIQAGLIPGRVNPSRTMTQVNTPLSPDPEWICASEDVVVMALQCATHWDALAHVSYRGVIYNGFPASSVGAFGAQVCGIDRIGSLVTRGILLDVARARGVEVLDPGYGITPEDLTASCEHAGVVVEPGDVVLVRTGQMVHLALDARPGDQRDRPGEQASATPGDPPKRSRSRRNLIDYAYPAPGLTMACASWFHERDVAAVATDTLSLEVLPCEHENLYLPVHVLHLVEMGMSQGQNWYLDELAKDCASDGRYSFLLDATPLAFTNALGSPLNPVAVK